MHVRQRLESLSQIHSLSLSSISLSLTRACTPEIRDREHPCARAQPLLTCVAAVRVRVPMQRRWLSGAPVRQRRRLLTYAAVAPVRSGSGSPTPLCSGDSGSSTTHLCTHKEEDDYFFQNSPWWRCKYLCNLCVLGNFVYNPANLLIYVSRLDEYETQTEFKNHNDILSKFEDRDNTLVQVRGLVMNFTPYPISFLGGHLLVLTVHIPMIGFFVKR
jgi:hypothetical protein